MKKNAPKPDKKTRRAALHAEGERKLSETLCEHAAYRLAKIAAPFAASGQSLRSSIYSAKELLSLCSKTIDDESRYEAVLDLEEPVPDSLDLTQLLDALKVSQKTLKSYILEVFWDIQVEVRSIGQGLYIDNQSIGQRVWDRLLAGESIIRPDLLKKIQAIRAKRFAESRKKPRKAVK